MANDPSTVSTERLLAESGWLHALARQLVGDHGAADDLVQDTLVSALRRPPRDDRPVRPWLAKVARNLVRARVRSDASRTRRETGHEPGRETPSAAELSEKLEGQHLLVEAIRELAEPYRSTILLHYWEHLDSEEIARRQGIAAGTVRWPTEARRRRAARSSRRANEWRSARMDRAARSADAREHSDSGIHHSRSSWHEHALEGIDGRDRGGTRSGLVDRGGTAERLDRGACKARNRGV